ncbi:DUF7544 domain-containing protein [Leifsonia shinshuensis]|uniref:DUF4064 domain-containing protein n=1 Tax=Leifsonia shinshuensis TaxID=150026 RepID=A0A7G6Y7U0_9MICO|nr:hypothetical protein [Leifsonia shinshuensis]QNE34555.1 hypothetical protein F1C12_05060 [Leifsonia shinshuensis]
MTDDSVAPVPTQGVPPVPPIAPVAPEWASAPQAGTWQTQPPAAAPVPVPAEKSPKLGRVAMIMAVCVISLSVLVSVLQGVFATTLRTYSTNAGAGFNMHPDQGWFGFQMLVGSIFGIWALTQGIVAVAQNRGRRNGIVAIVLAAAAPIVSLIVWMALGFAFGQHVQG